MGSLPEVPVALLERLAAEENYVQCLVFEPSDIDFDELTKEVKEAIQAMQVSKRDTLYLDVQIDEAMTDNCSVRKMRLQILELMMRNFLSLANSLRSDELFTVYRPYVSARSNHF